MYFEQRKFARLPCKALVRIYNDTNMWETTLVDVSASVSPLPTSNRSARKISDFLCATVGKKTE